MTQIFKADGAVVPVTAVLASKNTVTQIKDRVRDGYTAVQIGFGQSKHQKKPQAGHLKNLAAVKTIREFAMTGEELANFQRGDMIDLQVFQVGDKVAVTGYSKGRGFQGVVKRHGFAGHPRTHGHKDQERMPGSIGSTAPQRVMKGKRMGGRMGHDRVTVSGLEVAAIDAEKNILYIKGALPGAKNGLIIITGQGEMKLQKTVAAQTEMQAPPSADKSAA